VQARGRRPKPDRRRNRHSPSGHLLRDSLARGAARGPEGSEPAQRLLEQRYATASSVPIAHDLPAERFVTLVVEDANGKRVRNLIGDYPRPRGHTTDCWGDLAVDS
jgi:hypothetical protein